MSASTIVGLVATLGVGGTLIQSLPPQREPSEWSRVFWAGVATAVFVSTLLGLAVVAMLPMITAQLSALHSVAYATAFAIGTVTMTVGAILDYVFIAERAAGNMFSRNAVVAAGKALLVVLFTLVVSTRELNLLVSWAAASTIGLAFGAGQLMHRVRLHRPSRPSTLCRTAMELRARLAGHQLIGMGAGLLPYVLPVLVTVRLSTRDNAYFYTTWMMAGVFLIISPALSQSLFAEGMHNPHELRVKARSALMHIGAILLPSVVVGFLAGGTLLRLFGLVYAHHAVGLFRIVLLASIPDAVTNVYIAVFAYTDG